jgi:hypothetical protein
MNPTEQSAALLPPLFRACMALRLPRGLYCLRGGVPLSDAEIRANLRKQHVATEQLVLALSDVFDGAKESIDASDAWLFSDVVVRARDLPASMIGVLALAAMLPEEGVVEPDELGFWMEAAP